MGFTAKIDRRMQVIHADVNFVHPHFRAVARRFRQLHAGTCDAAGTQIFEADIADEPFIFQDVKQGIG